MSMTVANLPRPDGLGEDRLHRLGRLGRHPPLLEGDRAVGEPGEPLDALRVLGEHQAVLVGQLPGEEVQQPLGLDGAGHADAHLGSAGAGALLGIERQEQHRLLDHAHRVEHRAASTREDQVG